MVVPVANACSVVTLAPSVVHIISKGVSNVATLNGNPVIIAPPVELPLLVSVIRHATQTNVPIRLCRCAAER